MTLILKIQLRWSIWDHQRLSQRFKPFKCQVQSGIPLLPRRLFSSGALLISDPNIVVVLWLGCHPGCVPASYLVSLGLALDPSRLLWTGYAAPLLSIILTSDSSVQILPTMSQRPWYLLQLLLVVRPSVDLLASRSAVLNSLIDVRFGTLSSLWVWPLASSMPDTLPLCWSPLTATPLHLANAKWFVALGKALALTVSLFRYSEKAHFMCVGWIQDWINCTITDWPCDLAAFSDGEPAEYIPCCAWYTPYYLD